MNFKTSKTFSMQSILPVVHLHATSIVIQSRQNCKNYVTIQNPTYIVLNQFRKHYKKKQGPDKVDLGTDASGRTLIKLQLLDLN